MNKWKKITLFTNILLTFSTVFVLLDTFLIPKTYAQAVKVENTASNTSSNTSIDTNQETSVTENSNIESTITETSYMDDNISITISTIREYETDIYIADVVVSDISYLQTALANNQYGRNIKETTSTIAENNNAILAINGDFYGFRDYGFVIRNGILYRENGSGEALVINKDGTFKIVDESSTSATDLLNNNAWQALSFGPGLIDNSEIIVGVNEEVGQAMNSNPRTAIGMISPLHYVFIVSDGRTSQSEGLTLYELAEVMKDLGVSVGYNLDGGGSSTMYFNGNVVNNPVSNSGERKVSDIVYIGY